MSLVLCTLGLVGCAASSALGSDNALLAAGSNRRFAHTLTTTARPDALWALWTDVPGWPDWDIALKAATLDEPFAVGARGRLSPQTGPSARFRIVEVEPGRSYTYETALPLGSLRVRRSWQPAGVGLIAFTHEVSFHGLTGRLFAARLGPGYRRDLPAVMDRLRDLAKSPASDSRVL